MNDVKDWLVGEVAAWITSERDKFRPQGAKIDQDDLTILAKYFTPEVLNRAATVRGVDLTDPPFYPLLIDRGFKSLPPFSQMHAVTFNDTIAISRQADTLDVSAWLGLLVHELARVEQFRRLGVQEFARIYVASYLRELEYGRIILEQHASSVEIAFHASEQPFSASDHLDTLMSSLSKHY
jgi:hypothetical protein